MDNPPITTADNSKPLTKTKTMAPNVNHQAAVEDERAAEIYTTARSMIPTIIKSESHRAGDQCADDSKFHDVGYTETESVPRIGEAPNNNFTRQPMISFFMGKCDDYNDTIERSITKSALMASFDVQEEEEEEEEEIDFIASSSTPSIEQLLELQHCTTAANAVAIFSTDEELARQLQAEEDDEEFARQLQAEEDESARQQREIIFRKSQHASRNTTTTTSYEKFVFLPLGASVAASGLP